MLPISVPSIFTVSLLNQHVRQLLEMEMGQIRLSAEISNFSQPSSGHWYFTLKDERAQVRCVMFRNSNRFVTFKPRNGQQVLIRASITLYEARGDYQLIAENMQPAGDGLLQQQFEQLKQQLTAEGLFKQDHKKPLPHSAKQIGVITSIHGAVLHDVLQVLQRRDPSLPVVIYPTSVQGVDAPWQIMKAIEIANQRAECDVLIVCRGGGALEDLWSFNDERVVRAIFNSRLPIVSAVGHETDVTLADFVADLRAPTPSAAAELISRDQLELMRQIAVQQQRMAMALDYYLAQCQRQFSQFKHRLQQQHPQLQLANQQTELVRLQNRLKQAISTQMAEQLQQLHFLQQRLTKLRLFEYFYGYHQRIQQQAYCLKQALERQCNQYRQRFSVVCSRLEAVSPLAILARGYNVTHTSAGTVLNSIKQGHRGEKIITRLQDGSIESEITQINAVKNT
ncbi:exodeoxyribonuclease VII large subunit [Candidatus Regiella insecticola]|uniref:Exodeoxyribonuclease 7 large subunit n=1 Tax=Candidatus Regiella insecticola TaxID=138073 RepID=A0A6L2ZK46_9ENTR|nr:exodeoxyribonuclease VII large subunit [Candidatus Regiella insecticola]GFN45146.1 exodeoxyribonuclease 7 large subunit [Candidatus Regiella insecticola]